MARKKRSGKRTVVGQAPGPGRHLPTTADTPSGRRQWPVVLVWAAVIVAAGIAAYSNSFTGPFIFDGKESILDNPYIRRLWPITEAMKAPPQATTSGRPVVCLSLAVNYAISGLDVWSYHGLNLAVHIAAGLLLMGVIRRTLLSQQLRQRFGKASTLLAAACALIWVVHPIQTQSVTYVIQRAESIMALLYLLTVYCAIRGFHSRRPVGWYILSTLACAAGMATKEVMATAPLIVLVYDWLFVSRSFGKAAKRWPFYVSLGATWLILGGLMATSPRSRSAGFQLESFGPLAYAQTQCKAVVHYIRLAFWPGPLVLDYTRKTVKSFSEYGLQGLGLVALLAATAIALWRKMAAGFLGVWFFLILAPTSSIMPIADPIFEHRMYLSLAAVIAAVVVGGYRLLSALPPSRRRMAMTAALASVAAVTVALTTVTRNRNEDYRDEITIMRDTVDKQPDNFMAWASLGAAYANAGRHGEAIDACREAIDLHPRMSYAYNSRGAAYANMGKLDEAIADFTRAIEIYPEHDRAIYNRAVTHKRKRMLGEAIADFTNSIRVNPRYAPSLAGRAECLAETGQFAQALADYGQAIRLDPRNTTLLFGRAKVHQRRGDWQAALADYDAMIRLRPNDPAGYNQRGLAYKTKGNSAKAIADFTRAVALDGKYHFAYGNRGLVHLADKDFGKAIADFTRAIQLQPSFLDAYNGRAVAYANTGKDDLAQADLHKALQIDPGNTMVKNNLRAIRAKLRSPQ